MCTSASMRMLKLVLLILILSTPASAKSSMEPSMTAFRQMRLQKIASMNYTRALLNEGSDDTCTTLIDSLGLAQAGESACTCTLDNATATYSLECNYDYCKDCRKDLGTCATLTEKTMYKYENNGLTYTTFNVCVTFSGSMTQTLCYSDEHDDAVCQISVGDGTDQVDCNYCLFISCPEDSVLPTNFLREFSFDCSNVLIHGKPGPIVTYCQAKNEDLTGVYAALATDQFPFSNCFAMQEEAPDLGSPASLSSTTSRPVGRTDAPTATPVDGNSIPTAEQNDGGDAPSAAPETSSSAAQQCATFISDLNLAPAGAHACTCTPNGVGNFFLVICDYSFCQDCNSDINSCATLTEQYIYNRNNRRVSYSSCVNMTGDVEGQICYSDRFNSDTCTITIESDGSKEKCNNCTTGVTCSDGASIPSDFFVPISFDCSNVLPRVVVDACSSTNETLTPNTILAGLRNDVFTFPGCWGSGEPGSTSEPTVAPAISSNEPISTAPVSSEPISTEPVSTEPPTAPPVEGSETPSPVSDEVAQVCSTLIGKLDLAPGGANACQCAPTNKAQTFYSVECDFSYCQEYNERLRTNATLSRKYMFSARGRRGSFTNCVNMTGAIDGTVCYSELFNSDECVITVGSGSDSQQCTSCTNAVNCTSGPRAFLAKFSFDCDNLFPGLIVDYCTASNSALDATTSIGAGLRDDFFTFESCFGGGEGTTVAPSQASGAVTPVPKPSPTITPAPIPTAMPVFTETNDQVCEKLISSLDLAPEGINACTCDADAAGKAFTLSCDYNYCQDCDESLGVCGNLMETRVYSRAGDYISYNFCIALNGTVQGTVCYTDGIGTSVCSLSVDSGSGPVQCNSCNSVKCNPGVPVPTNFFAPVSFDCSNVLPSGSVVDYCTANDETLTTDSVLVALRNDVLKFSTCYSDEQQTPTSPPLSDDEVCSNIISKMNLVEGGADHCTCLPDSTGDVFTVNCDYSFCKDCNADLNTCAVLQEEISYDRDYEYVTYNFCMNLTGEINSVLCYGETSDSDTCHITVDEGEKNTTCTSCFYPDCDTNVKSFYVPVSFDCSNIAGGPDINYCTSDDNTINRTSVWAAMRNDVFTFSKCFASGGSPPGQTPSSLENPEQSDHANCDTFIANQLLPPNGEGACTCEPNTSGDEFTVSCNYDYCEQCMEEPKVCGAYSEVVKYAHSGRYISSDYCVDLSGVFNTEVCVYGNPSDADSCNITLMTDGKTAVCSSCQYVQCGNGSRAMSMNCDNVVDGAVANFCNPEEVMALNTSTPMIALRRDVLNFKSCFANGNTKHPRPTPAPVESPVTTITSSTAYSGDVNRIGILPPFVLVLSSLVVAAVLS